MFKKYTESILSSVSRKENRKCFHQYEDEEEDVMKNIQTSKVEARSTVYYLKD